MTDINDRDQRGAGQFNLEGGLQVVKDALRGVDQDTFLDFSALESRLLENIRSERLCGSTETVRSERAKVIQELNRLAIKHLGRTYNDACEGNLAQQADTGGNEGAASPVLPQSRRTGANRKITVLFLTVDPTATPRLRPNAELQEIQDELRRLKHPDSFRLRQGKTVHFEDLFRSLSKIRPDIVHFSGRGTAFGELCVEKEGRIQRIEPSELAALFEQFADVVKCIMLDACYSKDQAQAIAQHVDYVIGMDQTIEDKTAIAFAAGFYQALSTNRNDYDASYQHGLTRITSSSIPSSSIPILAKRQQNRKEVSVEAIAALHQASPVVLITALPGIGKTRFVNQIEAQCRRPDTSGAPPFDAIITVTENQPGATTLSKVLDDIARELRPSVTHLEEDKKQQEVDRLVRDQHILLIVDSSETVSDDKLREWLSRWPRGENNSKALVTDIDRKGLSHCHHIRLPGLNEYEAQEVIDESLNRTAMGHLTLSRSESRSLVSATGGNPMAIKMACGRLLSQSLDEVIDDLQSAKGEFGALFSRLFARCWTLLEEADVKLARDILLVMPLFPDSVSRDALGRTVGVDAKDSTFHDAISRLNDLALLNIDQAGFPSGQPRYTLHPLVRTFARSKLDRPDFQGLKEYAQRRWIDWAEEFARSHAWPWDDLRKLDEVEPEEKNLQFAIELAVQRDRKTSVIAIVDGLDHYYYVRGLWKEKQANDELRIATAWDLSDLKEEARGIAQQVQLWCRMGKITGEKFIARMDRLTKLAEDPDLDADVAVQIQHTFAFHEMTQRRYVDAYKRLCECQEREQELTKVNLAIATRHWLATCLYKQTLMVDDADRQDLLNQAKQYFQEARERAEPPNHNYKRSELYCRINLAKIAIDQNAYDDAKRLLEETMKEARLYHEQRYIAQMKLVFARLHLRCGEIPAAREAFREAREIFDRIGLYDDRDDLERIGGELAAAMK